MSDTQRRKTLFIGSILGLVCLGGMTWAAAPPVTFERTIDNPHPHAGNQFGYALNSYNGNLLAGSFGGQNVYVMDIQTGAELLHITSPETQGTAISFGDAVLQVGNRIVVGDRQADFGGFVRVGSAYIFDGQTGQPLLTIRNPSPQNFGNFSEAMETVGGRLYLSSESADSSRSGKVYVYDPLTGQSQGSILNPQGADGSYGFGFSMQARGADLFVGAIGEKVFSAHMGAVFRYSASGVKTLTIPDPDLSFTDAAFGWAIDADDTRLLVGAPKFSSITNTGVGEAFLFNADTGALLQTFANPEPADNAAFGQSVALVGNYAVIGAPGTNLNPGQTGPFNVGAAYVFDLSTGGLVAKLLDPAPHQNDEFTYGEGQGGLLGIGNRLIAANARKAVAGVGNVGSVYVYTLVPEPSTFGLVLIAASFVSTRRIRRLECARHSSE